MWADFKAHLVVVISLTMTLMSIGAGARRAAPISNRTTGAPFQYEVAAGDSLVSLGARYGIDPREIAFAHATADVTTACDLASNRRWTSRVFICKG